VSSLPGTPHPDSIGCSAIGNVVPDDPDALADPFAGLEGKENGVVSTAKRCGLPCEKTIPDSAMAPAEQQRLTRIVGAAFFEGTLRDDLAARCFLHDAFAKEEDAVLVKSR
jgi:hypothetical protein